MVTQPSAISVRVSDDDVYLSFETFGRFTRDVLMHSVFASSEMENIIILTTNFINIWVAAEILFGQES